MMKLASTKIQFSRLLPTDHNEKNTDIAIVRETNKLCGSILSVKSASMMMREGRVGVSPKKKGPSYIISTQIWNLTKSAFVSFLKLEHAQSSKQSNMKGMALKVNAYLIKAGFGRTDQYIMRKLRKEMVDRMDVGEQFVVVLFLIILFTLSPFTSIIVEVSRILLSKGVQNGRP